MYPAVYHSAKKSLQTYSVVGIVILAAVSLFAVVPLIGGGGNAAGPRAWNVTFMEMNGTVPGKTGSADYFTTAEAMFTISATNLTMVVVEVSWQDQSLSPATDPAVTATITGPNGTAPATGRAASAGQTFRIDIPNEAPANTTVDASSAEEALAAAAGEGTNATLGSGEWTVSLDVGASLFGRIRPSGSISYSIAITFVYFEGAAKPL